MQAGVELSAKQAESRAEENRRSLRAAADKGGVLQARTDEMDGGRVAEIAALCTGTQAASLCLLQAKIDEMEAELLRMEAVADEEVRPRPRSPEISLSICMHASLSATYL